MPTSDNYPKNKSKIVVYAMLDSPIKLEALNAVITNLTSGGKSPWDRIVLGFFRPDIEYPDTLTDISFEDVTKYDIKPGVFPNTTNGLHKLIKKIKNLDRPAGGKVEVFLSMGGWNCIVFISIYK